MNAIDGAPPASGSSYYGTTLWTEIIKARQGKEEAWEILVRRYRRAVHAQILKHFKEEAEDLTSDFMGKVFAHQLVPRADRSAGRFRAYLADALRKFITSEWRRRYAIIRGGSAKEGKVVQILSLDEANHADHADESVTPEDFGRELDRAFAKDTFNHTIETIQTWYVAAAKEDAARRAREFELLIGDQANLPVVEIAMELGVSEGAVKTARHRLRRQFVAAFRVAVADTSLPGDVDGEASYLLGLLA